MIAKSEGLIYVQSKMSMIEETNFITKESVPKLI